MGWPSGHAVGRPLLVLLLQLLRRIFNAAQGMHAKKKKGEAALRTQETTCERKNCCEMWTKIFQVFSCIFEFWVSALAH